MEWLLGIGREWGSLRDAMQTSGTVCCYAGATEHRDVDADDVWWRI